MSLLGNLKWSIGRWLMRDPKKTDARYQKQAARKRTARKPSAKARR